MATKLKTERNDIFSMPVHSFLGCNPMKPFLAVTSLNKMESPSEQMC